MEGMGLGHRQQAVPLTVAIETPTKGRYDRRRNDEDDFVFGKNPP
jgi:hypothetical protein